VSLCAPHREFLAAIADGETELVPRATLDHVEQCPDCRREIHMHRLVTSRLRQALEHQDEATPARRRVGTVPARLRLIAAGIAAALLVAAAGTGWSVLTRPDPVQAAVTASSQPLQIESGDPSLSLIHI